MKALVNDTVWSRGANKRVLLSGTSNAAVDVYPWFDSAEGSYHYIRDIPSKFFNNRRDLVVYTPPSYTENTLAR